MKPLEPSTPRPISARGLSVVVDPLEADVDIVFIHGFRGGPENSWTKRQRARGSQTPLHSPTLETPRLESPISPSSIWNNASEITSCFWPRDLLPETLPNARVMTYGYEIEMLHWITAPKNRQTIYDIAKDFMIALDAERQADPRRPIIFIAHSLGGIIVKEMLWQSSCFNSSKSSNGLHLRRIFKSTVGLMFFGVPHSGTDPGGVLIRFAQMMLRALGYSMNKQISNALLPGAQRLMRLDSNFAPIARERNWTIYSFQEQYGPGHTMIVEDGSSKLGIPELETIQQIAKGHFQMTQFSGADDADFKTVEIGLRVLKAKVAHYSAFLLRLKMMKAKAIRSLFLLLGSEQ